MSETHVGCDYPRWMGKPEAAEQERRYVEAVAQLGPAVERLARGYERDPDKRRDLLQEIHVALWRSFQRFDERCSLRTWVYRVAHNTATSRILRPLTHAPSIIAIDDGPETPVDPLVSAEQQFDRTRTLERLYVLVHRLRPVDRQVMLLYLDELDAASIAEITGLSPANVATRVHRLKQMLIQQFYEGRQHGQR